MKQLTEQDFRRDTFYAALSKAISKVVVDNYVTPAEVAHGLSRELVFWSDVAMEHLDHGKATGDPQ